MMTQGCDKIGKLLLPKLALFDIDGTLLDSTHQISQETKEAVAKLKSKGVEVGLSSGRGYFAAKDIIAELKLDGPLILYAGATVFNSVGEVVQSIGLSTAAVHLLTTELQTGGFEYECYTATKFYSVRDSPLLRIHWEYMPVKPEIEPLPPEAEVMKLQVVCENSRANELLGLLKRLALPIRVAQAHGARHPEISFVSILDAAASPDVVLQRLARYDLSRVWAFGDGASDIPLLQAVGLGVAMGNASSEVKEVADFIAPHVDEGGVGVAVGRLLELIG